jgi:hypothetical protein
MEAEAELILLSEAGFDNSLVRHIRIDNTKPVLSVPKIDIYLSVPVNEVTI